jgi:hypothetical protein
VQLEGLGHLIGTQTRYLPACRIVPQPSTLPRVQLVMFKKRKEKLTTFCACKMSLVFTDVDL